MHRTARLDLVDLILVSAVDNDAAACSDEFAVPVDPLAVREFGDELFLYPARRTHPRTCIRSCGGERPGG